jgi:glutathione S-transferase
LFGAYSAADMSFAPVVSRFRTYAVELDEVCARYADAAWEHPHVVEWRDAAEREEWINPEFDR